MGDVEHLLRLIILIMVVLGMFFLVIAVVVTNLLSGTLAQAKANTHDIHRIQSDVSVIQDDVDSITNR